MHIEKDQCHIRLNQEQRKSSKRKKSAVLKTAVYLQGLLNKCNLVYLTEWSMKDFSRILHNSLWGGPWNNFESTSNNYFAQRVILVSGVTQLQSTTMCSCSGLFDNKQMFACHGEVNVWVASFLFLFIHSTAIFEFTQGNSQTHDFMIFIYLMSFSCFLACLQVWMLKYLCLNVWMYLFICITLWKKNGMDAIPLSLFPFYTTITT